MSAVIKVRIITDSNFDGDITFLTITSDSIGSLSIRSDAEKIVLRTNEELLVRDGRTGAALLVQFVLREDFEFRSRLNHRGFAVLREEINSSLRPNGRGGVFTSQSFSPYLLAGCRFQALRYAGLSDQKQIGLDVKHGWNLRYIFRSGPNDVRVCDIALTARANGADHGVSETRRGED